jgi:hypothetical protein
LEENYRPDVHGSRPDIRPCLRLPHGRGFTRGRVFTVRDAVKTAPAQTRKKKQKKIKIKIFIKNKKKLLFGS